VKRKIRSTFKRRPQPGYESRSNVAYFAHEGFRNWKNRYGGVHPPIKRDRSIRL
jgi:hypothetical protein